jgi:hypothetical protein
MQEEAHTPLGALVGRWLTRGSTRDTAEAIEAVDTYEWLPGRFGLLHIVDARVGDDHVEGAEIIGWDAARNAYVTQYFGSDGPSAYKARFGEEEGALVWSMHSAPIASQAGSARMATRSRATGSGWTTAESGCRGCTSR